MSKKIIDGHFYGLIMKKKLEVFFQQVEIDGVGMIEVFLRPFLKRDMG